MKKALVFEISGKYALFRKSYSPLSPISYSVPPPTAVIGIIAAIAGYDKTEYIAKINNDEYAIAISILKPIKRYRAGLNLLITKGSKLFHPHGDSPRTQIPAEFIKDVAYNIYFTHNNIQIYQDIKSQLEKNESKYTLSLGIAQCLADMNYIGEYDIIEKNEQQVEVEINSIVPVYEGIIPIYKCSDRIFRFRVPAKMKSDRTVIRYADLLINENAQSIKVLTNHYEVVNNEPIIFLRL